MLAVKGAIALGKQKVKVWMMIIEEGIFAGHPFLALPPFHFALVALASLTLALLALNPLTFVN